MVVVFLAKGTLGDVSPIASLAVDIRFFIIGVGGAVCLFARHRFFFSFLGINSRLINRSRHCPARLASHVQFEFLVHNSNVAFVAVSEGTFALYSLVLTLLIAGNSECTTVWPHAMERH